MNRIAVTAGVLFLFATSLPAQDTINKYGVSLTTGTFDSLTPSSPGFLFDVTTSEFDGSLTVTFDSTTFDFTQALSSPDAPYSLKDCGWSLATSAGILNALLNPQPNISCAVYWVALAAPNPLIPNAYNLALSIVFCDYITETACISSKDTLAAAFVLNPPDGLYAPVSSKGIESGYFEDNAVTVALESTIFPPGSPAPATPEASTFGLLGIGLLTLAGIQFRRRRASQSAGPAESPASGAMPTARQ